MVSEEREAEREVEEDADMVEAVEAGGGEDAREIDVSLL